MAVGLQRSTRETDSIIRVSNSLKQSVKVFNTTNNKPISDPIASVYSSVCIHKISTGTNPEQPWDLVVVTTEILVSPRTKILKILPLFFNFPTCFFYFLLNCSRASVSIRGAEIHSGSSSCFAIGPTPRLLEIRTEDLLHTLARHVTGTYFW